MREALLSYTERSGLFRADFSHLGAGKGLRPMVRLENITDDAGNFITDHVWVNCTQSLEYAHPTAGCHLQFRAMARWYKRGDGSADLCLFCVTKVRRCKNAPKTIKYPLTGEGKTSTLGVATK